MDSTRFIFFDETPAKTNMTRLYGRALGGERLVDSTPHGHWKTTTFVAGLSLDGIVAPGVCRANGLPAPAARAHSADGQSFLPQATRRRGGGPRRRRFHFLHPT